MSNFVRIKTAATKQVANRNLRLAKERSERGKAMGLSGAALHGYILGLRAGATEDKEATMSLRGYIGWCLLTSGIGVYDLEDIRENCEASGVAETGEVSIAQVRAAISSYLVPRAAECQPYFPFTLVYSKRDAQVRVMRAEGVGQARVPAPKATKVQGPAAVLAIAHQPVPNGENV